MVCDLGSAIDYLIVYVGYELCNLRPLLLSSIIAQDIISIGITCLLGIR